jgi:uncharacterized protein YecE (DUF72 family)
MIATIQPPTKRHSYVADTALVRLAQNGIAIGLPRSVVLEQHAAVPLIEIELRREDIPTEQGLRVVTEQTRAQILWRITIDDLHLDKTFTQPDWQLFVSLLASQPERHLLAVAFDRSIEYATEALDEFERFRDAAGMQIFLDTEHASWKTARVQSVLKSLKLPHVFIDGPTLPGIVKDVSYFAGGTVVFRCLGRNSRDWFEHGQERYIHNYTAQEIDELAGRIRRLRDAVDTVYVIMHNRPAASAAKNVRELADVLVERR